MHNIAFTIHSRIIVAFPCILHCKNPINGIVTFENNKQCGTKLKWESSPEWSDKHLLNYPLSFITSVSGPLTRCKGLPLSPQQSK